MHCSMLDAGASPLRFDAGGAAGGKATPQQTGRGQGGGAAGGSRRKGGDGSRKQAAATTTTPERRSWLPTEGLPFCVPLSCDAILLLQLGNNP